MTYITNLHWFLVRRASQPSNIGRLHSFGFKDAWECAEFDDAGPTISYRESGRMTSEPPNMTRFFGLTCMCMGRNMSPMKLHALHLHAFRRKTYTFTQYFGIIINYYSQGLKPPRLAPLSYLSAPSPLPRLFGSLVPHQSFIVVSPHAEMFIFY